MPRKSLHSHIRRGGIRKRTKRFVVESISKSVTKSGIKMKSIRKRPLILLSIFLFIVLIVVRFQILDLTNGDHKLILTWYDFLKQNGVMGLGDDDFSNYPPAYLYLLWFFTLVADIITPAYALKIIPTLFDIISA